MYIIQGIISGHHTEFIIVNTDRRGLFKKNKNKINSMNILTKRE